MRGPEAFSLSCLATIFLVCSVADIVAFVLDSPVSSSIQVHVGSGRFSLFHSGDGQ